MTLGLVSPALAARKAHAIARLVSREGKPVGTVDFATVTRGILVTFDLHDLPPGPHAIHLHTSGNCDAKTGFTAAEPILTAGRSMSTERVRQSYNTPTMRSQEPFGWTGKPATAAEARGRPLLSDLLQ